MFHNHSLCTQYNSRFPHPSHGVWRPQALISDARRAGGTSPRGRGRDTRPIMRMNKKRLLVNSGLYSVTGKGEGLLFPSHTKSGEPTPPRVQGVTPTGMLQYGKQHYSRLVDYTLFASSPLTFPFLDIIYFFILQ